MIANIGPAHTNYEETLMTLRYAYRAKSIKNQPIKNEDIKDAKLLALQDEIERLKDLIERKTNGDDDVEYDGGGVSSSSSSDEDDDNKKDESTKKLELGKMEVDELAQKLQLLEKQMVHGGKNIVDSVNENEMRIEQQKNEIAARKVWMDGDDCQNCGSKFKNCCRNVKWSCSKRLNWRRRVVRN